VARSDLRVAPREGDVEGALGSFDPGELVDTEGLPDGVHPAVLRQDRLEALGRQAEYLDVEVLDREGEQGVAHGAADEVGRGPRRAQRREQPLQARRQLEGHGSGGD
jgi:hypothetical protein